MNNEIHGLCPKCIQTFNSDPTPAINYQCQKCNQNEAQFISRNEVICLKCYYKQKQSVSVLKKGSQLKMSNLLTLVPKGQMSSSMTSFLTRTGKVIKKLQKLLISYDLKSEQLVKQLHKKSLLPYSSAFGSNHHSTPISWQKIQQKCNKTGSLIYFFVNKQIVFGSFHTQGIKITSQNSFVEDIESGIFLTQRLKYDLNIFKTNKNIVKYNQKTKSIIFGDPAAFQIVFNGKDILIKSQFNRQLKWDHFFVYKV